jgi:excisionase family DNA binding protein
MDHLIRNMKPPRTRQEFTRYLRDTFDQLQAIHEADSFEQVEIADLVEDVSVMAARFGAGHLIDPPHPRMKPRDALVVVGRLLAWTEENRGSYFDSSQAADYLGITGASLYALVERKRLVPLRGPRRTYRFTRKQLDDYLAKSS